MDTRYIFDGFDTNKRRVLVEERDGNIVLSVNNKEVFTARGANNLQDGIEGASNIPLTKTFVEAALANAHRRRARFIQNLATYGKVPAGAIHSNEKDIASLKHLLANPSIWNGVTEQIEKTAGVEGRGFTSPGSAHAFTPQPREVGPSPEELSAYTAAGVQYPTEDSNEDGR